MNCPSCKQPNAGDRNYCGECGAPLARHCTCCGFRNLTTDRYCGGCGSSLSPAEFSARPLRPSGVANAPPSGPSAVSPPGDDDLAELLAAAKEGAEPPPEDPGVRVSQGDIDSLFGD